MRTLRLVLALALLAPRAASAQSSHFDTETLSVEGDLLQVVAADLDGDGRQDLLATSVSSRSHAPQRRFSVFWNKGGTFAARPDLVFAADIDACAFDIAALEGQAAATLLVLTPRGVRAHPLAGRAVGKARMLVEQPTFCLATEPGDLARIRVAQPLSSPGAADLVVPGLGSVGVYANRGDHYVRTAELRAPFTAQYSHLGKHDPTASQPGRLPGVQAEFTLPAIHLADMDGDGRPDLVLTQGAELGAYLQGEGLTFPAEPSLRRTFAIRSQEEKQARAEVTIQVTDLDGDGVADAVIRKDVNHGITDAKSTLWVVLGRRGAPLPETPDQVIEGEGGAVGGLQLFDVTGDGHPDLLVPSVDMGVVSVVRMLTTQSVKVHLRAFPFEATRRFATKPAAERDLTMKISLSGDSDMQAVELNGDFDGDGKPDLAMGTTGEELSIFPAVAGGAVYAEAPAEQLAIRARGQTVAADLNHSGRSDLILYSPATSGHQSEILVLLNRGGW